MNFVKFLSTKKVPFLPNLEKDFARFKNYFTSIRIGVILASISPILDKGIKREVFLP